MPLYDAFIYIADDHNIRFTGVRKEEDGTYLNSGIATYELQESDETLIVGGSGTLDYTAASNGNYKAVLDKTITANLVRNKIYLLVGTFEKDGYETTRVLRLLAKHRGAS